MVPLRNIIGHFSTITRHKILVGKECFRVGLYRQGFLHDLSKYSCEEFSSGVRYYQGNRSPNAAEKEALGYSRAWLHHKGRNKHHFEYWIDFEPGRSGKLVGNPMPLRYVIEMFLDRVAASKIYRGKDYTDRSALDYYNILRGAGYMHRKTQHELEFLLNLLADRGEDYTYAFIRALLLREKVRRVDQRREELGSFAGRILRKAEVPVKAARQLKEQAENLAHILLG